MRASIPGGLAAALLILGLVPAGVSAAKTPEEQCLKEAARVLHVKASELNFDHIWTGTNGDDTTSADYYGPGGSHPPDLNFVNQADSDLICGFKGDDSVLSVGFHDLFIGGKGDDGVSTNVGTFDGGKGTDAVASNLGTFNGGKGDDSVTDNLGTFDGGKGDDAVTNDNRDTFDGGKGDDLVVNLFSGTFDGGKGFDSVTNCASIPPAVTNSVEDITGAPCFEL